MLYQFILPFRINDNRIIKVGDFGISKDYLRSYYRHWSNTESEKTVIKLPFKWMALETLMMVYSLRRQMWSVDYIFINYYPIIQWPYGVLCWEVFSLGKTPYPGLDPLSVVQLLDSGGRLPIPNNAACSEEM